MKANPEAHKALGIKSYRKLKNDVITAYGGRCACCNEARPEFMTIDHIHGGGGRHRAEVGHVYRWLRQNGYPPGFQVLCFNCNQARGHFGYCPHEKEQQ